MNGRRGNCSSSGISEQVREKWPPSPIDYQKTEGKWGICYCFSIIKLNIWNLYASTSINNTHNVFRGQTGLLPATGFFVLFWSILKWRKLPLRLREHLRQGSEASVARLVLNFTSSYSTFAWGLRAAHKTSLKRSPGQGKPLTVY